MTKPILIFGYGNLSRGDDALGPLLLEAIQEKVDLPTCEILSDFQLQVEHALDLENRKLVLFVDAAFSCTANFELMQLQPIKDKSYTTHAMSPASVLQVYQSIIKLPPPPCFLLSIQAFQFELGAAMSQQATKNLQLALSFVEALLNNAELSFWQQQASLAEASKESDLA